MMTEKILDSMEQLPENFKKEAMELMKYKHEKKSGRRSLKILLIAAALASLFTLSAFAVGNYINSPEQAEKVARQELEKMRDMGILSEKFSVEDVPTERVLELPVFEGEDYFFGRIWPHRYSVQWYKDAEEGGDNPYTVVTQVDTAEGKIIAVTIEALAGEEETPYRVLEDQYVPVGYDEQKQEPIMDTVDYEYYKNYYDIIPDGITVDELCSRLNEYWGFEGYSIVESVDDFYGFEDVETPTGDSLVAELPQDNYYLSVLFEGDQQGVPRYIQTAEFPGYVAVIIGTNHAVG